MAAYILLGTLAAMGLVSLCWAALGWLLPGGRGFTLVCPCLPEPETLARWRWLRSLGLISWTLLIVTEEPVSVPEDMENCSPEELFLRLEMERNRSYGTGTGDPAGRHQRRGISEL